MILLVERWEAVLHFVATSSSSSACGFGMTAVVATSTSTGIGNANAIDIMTILPMISLMTATAIVGLRGEASGAASGREHGGAAKNKSRIVGGLCRFGIYWPIHVFSLTAIPCRMHRISFDLRS
jgi:hypothetical protein